MNDPIVTQYYLHCPNSDCLRSVNEVAEQFNRNIPGNCREIPIYIKGSFTNRV